MTYAVLHRCGMNPDLYMDGEDFRAIVEFNTPETATALGTAVSEMSEMILRTIEKTVKNAERTEEHENRADLHKRGGIQSPELKAERNGKIGKYGRMRREYLKTHRPILYNRLLLSEKLYAHLSEIDRTVQERTERIMNELMKQNGVTEKMKAENPMLWVQMMNNLKAQAEEVILTELIYS